MGKVEIFSVHFRLPCNWQILCRKTECWMSDSPSMKVIWTEDN